MGHLGVFGIGFLIILFIWLIALTVYNKLITSFDFGSLPRFALKSVILVSLVVLVIMYAPYGLLLSVLAWGIGLMILFRLDLLEARILVAMLWLLTFGAGIVIYAMMAGHGRLG